MKVKKISKEEELSIALEELKEVCSYLKVTDYSNELYTEYEDKDHSGMESSFSLYERTFKNYEVKDALKKVITLLFDWDYKCEAKFDVKLAGNVLSIKFHEPVIKYVVTDKTFDI